MDQRAHRSRAFHRVRQPDVERELPGLADRAGKNQKRNEGGAGTDREEPGGFETTFSTIVEEKSTTAAVEPEDAEKKSEIANARGDERFLRRSGCARFVNPETDQKIGGEPDQFPADEEQEQAVRDDDAEHGGGEKREVSKKTGE